MAPKKFTQSARDKAIALALRYVPAGILESEKEKAGVETLPLESMQIENKSSDAPDYPSSTSEQQEACNQEDGVIENN